MEINIKLIDVIEDPNIVLLLIEHFKSLIAENGRTITLRVSDLPPKLHANSSNIIFESYFGNGEDGVECPMFWYNKVFFSEFNLQY